MKYILLYRFGTPDTHITLKANKKYNLRRKEKINTVIELNRKPKKHTQQIRVEKKEKEQEREIERDTCARLKGHLSYRISHVI